jgi:hypothetical protein
MLDVFLQMFCTIVHCTTVNLFVFLSSFECIVSTLYRFGFFSLTHLALVLEEKKYGNKISSKCTLMNENEKGKIKLLKKKKRGNILMCFVVTILIYILLVCVHFFLRNVFLCGHTTKKYNVYLFLMDGCCVCVCVNSFFLGLLLSLLQFSFSYTHSVFDYLFAVLYLFLDCIL